MRVSWNWLSEWIDLSAVSGPAALGELLTQRGLEVEAIEKLDQGLENVIVAQILSREKHPQADRLNLCQVSVGEPTQPLQIVCGAQNMRVGDHVALAQVGANLPNGIKISESKIRGVLSQGMLCSAEELKLEVSPSEAEGIIILPSTTIPGTPLAQVLGRNDTIFFLKLTVNRADCLSHWGLAREIAAALGQKLPAWVSARPSSPKPSSPEKSPVSVSLEVGENAPQFHGAYIEGIQVGPSPAWLVQRLEALGSRSINNVVDATNWVMLELGQPSHAYDADQIQGKRLHVRYAREGETLVLLDGQAITLASTEMVVADEKGPLSLGGVMGGQSSEIRPTTKNLFLEAAEWSPSLVRKTAVRHQHRTDAAQRFERGVDPAGHPRAMQRLIDLVIELAGGKQVGAVIEKQASRQNLSDLQKEISFGQYELHDFLGFSRDLPALNEKNFRQILEGLDCQVAYDHSTWKVQPPLYRLDLKIKEDIAEELARSVGYDLIPDTLPQLTSSPNSSVSSLGRSTLIDRAKESLVRSGLCEALHLSFTSQTWLSQLGLNSSVKLINPLSEEYEVMVSSLLSGLIRSTLNNWNHHFGSESLAIRLFELRPVFSADSNIHAQSESETGVQERWKLAFVLAGPRYAGGLKNDLGEVDFYDLKATVENLCRDFGVKGVRYLPLSLAQTAPNTSASKGAAGAPGVNVAHLFHPGQSVEVWAGDTAVGVMGLLHPKQARGLKARGPVWLAELDWDSLIRRARAATEFPQFKASAEHPPIERDFALLVRQEISCEKICQLALKLGKPLAKAAKVFDIYRGSQVPEGMTSVAVRVIFYDENRSLTENEAETASARLVEGWKKELGIELRG